MREHALLSASSAYRWIACPPSARLSEEFDNGEDCSSPSADEGTLAHALAEWHLTEGSQSDLEKIKKSEYYGQDMEEFVKVYTDYVEQTFKRLQELDSDSELHIEQRLDFSDYVQDGFGTGDAVLVGGNRLYIVDLKYGRHIPVVAYDNPQLKLYALGALAEYGWLYDISHIELTIVQPRNQGVTTSVLSRSDLERWGRNVSEIAKLAYAGKGEIVAGDHCRFCSVAPRCRALADLKLGSEVNTEKAPALLSDTELARVMVQAEGLVSYCNKVKEYMLQEAVVDGRKFGGFKLVAGRTTTTISDEKAAIEKLLKKGFVVAELMEPAHLKGITHLKKVLGEKQFSTVLKDFIVKSPGRAILVPEDDTRPALDVAEGFNVIEKETEK